MRDCPIMCEGPSSISGPIPPDPSLFPERYRQPASARGRLEGNQEPPPPHLALPSGPLAPDPLLYPGYYSARTPAPPRAGAAAAHIRERSQKGMVGLLLKMEGVSLGSTPPRSHPQPRDYGKENVRRLREIQKRCREQEAERERTRPLPVKALWTSSKYQNVTSKVMIQLQEANPPKKPECQNFLRAHSGSSPTRSLLLQRCPSSQSLNSCDSEMQVCGRTVDFVGLNARAAGKTALRRSRSLQNISREQPKPVCAPRGLVPHYLEKRKRQWRQEEEDRRKNMPDPSVPAGHTLVPEKERQEMLQSLKNTQQTLVKELLALPMRTDTLSVRSRRAHLDCRLSELDEAIKVFSRDKVFVRTDS
ncbi:enkurin domain-containing protein 1 isoform X1 [Scleropages formosus]|uniref:enkurin domain-containing protein 1 isoform X1 n=2 Tax=Scleropages formosus TaxID=113540 RepID=UPI0010FA76C2|nr:enkurin domain-containing protein 1 isoform X1 [Scleropages formosus]